MADDRGVGDAVEFIGALSRHCARAQRKRGLLAVPEVVWEFYNARLNTTGEKALERDRCLET